MNALSRELCSKQWTWTSRVRNSDRLVGRYNNVLTEFVHVL